jgi:hypothetical protein
MRRRQLVDSRHSVPRFGDRATRLATCASTLLVLAVIERSSVVNRVTEEASRI